MGNRIVTRQGLTCVVCVRLATEISRTVWQCFLCDATVRAHGTSGYEIEGGNEDAAEQAMYRMGGLGAVRDLRAAS